MNTSKKKILLVGNPNVGKSTMFNALCNLSQKTGNYAGVTVSSHTGEYVWKDQKVEVVDLPGSYSIYPSSEDEAVFSEYLLNEKESYEGVVYILDCLNMKRGLLLLEQIQDLKIPMMIVVNQIDEAEKRGVSIDFQRLSELYSVKVIPANAKDGEGMEAIKSAVELGQFFTLEENHFEIPAEYKGIIEEENYQTWRGIAMNESKAQHGNIVPKRLQTQETIRRYQAIEGKLSQIREVSEEKQNALTEKLDKILVHPFWGYVVFAAVLLLMFQLVFFMASYPMDWIDAGFSYLSDWVKDVLPEGPLNSLLADGVVPGIGGIVIFAPQIFILLYFLYLLEDSGYMARVVFLMDRLLKPFGLNGKSIVPLVSGVACAVPAVMSARNIENFKERLITILVTPFMTCSARLPVYSIIISLVIPKGYFAGIVGYQALALLVMYALGFFMAILSAWVLKWTVQQKTKSFLVLELPLYKVPQFGRDVVLTLDKVKDFVFNSGKIIFTISIILWGFSYVGAGKDSPIQVADKLEDSYLAQMGKVIEPVVEPLGYDWKMGVGIISSFAAREVFVGTMATLYSLDEEVEEDRLIEKMRNDKRVDGTPTFTLATGVSILLYYAFAMQCISTIAIVYRETKSWKWTMIQVVGMSSLAYVVSFLAYQFLK